MRYTSQYIAVLLMACGNESISSPVGEETVARTFASTALPVPHPEECPYWDLAPCGEDWYSLWQCDSCDLTYACLSLGEPRIYRWWATSWPCECVDPKTGELLKGTPGCEETE